MVLMSVNTIRRSELTDIISGIDESKPEWLISQLKEMYVDNSEDDYVQLVRDSVARGNAPPRAWSIPLWPGRTAIRHS